MQNSRLFKICLILITFAILAGIGFYAWSVVELVKIERMKILSPFEKMLGL